MAAAVRASEVMGEVVVMLACRQEPEVETLAMGEAETATAGAELAMEVVATGMAVAATGMEVMAMAGGGDGDLGGGDDPEDEIAGPVNTWGAIRLPSA